MPLEGNAKTVERVARDMALGFCNPSIRGQIESFNRTRNILIQQFGEPIDNLELMTECYPQLLAVRIGLYNISRQLAGAGSDGSVLRIIHE